MTLLSASLVVARRGVSPRRLLFAGPHISRRFLSASSSVAPKKANEEGSVAENDEAVPKHPQAFVKTRLEPGEWDEQHMDPIDRPPFKSNAKIISAEDFANRPLVGIGDEFDSMRDAMLTLSWLDQKQCDDIYQMYLDMMGSMQKNEGVTSHEYVMRVIAQKYNLSARRVAAVVQLAHNEDQIRKEGGKIHYELANQIEAQIKEHIRNAYDAYGEEMPDSFVEDPSAVSGSGDPERRTSHTARVEDLYDVDEMMAQTLVREQEEARVAIDTHVYIEDVDDSLIDVKVDANCQKLLERHTEVTRPSDISPLPESGVTKDRFKYVAHVIDTREEKKKLKKQRYKRKKRRGDKVEGNTLVEHGGNLRVATVAEVKETSWKPVRNTKEFIYAGVKQAWVDRTLHGKTGTWGRFEETRKPEDEEDENAKDDEEDENAKNDEEDENAKNDEELAAEGSDSDSSSSEEEGSSSDSSDEEGDSEADTDEGEENEKDDDNLK